MRIASLSLVAVLCLNTGCLTAARKVEQTLGRDRERSREPENRPAETMNRPPAAASATVVAVRPGHPRLFVPGPWPAPVDDVARDWQAILVKRADEVLTQPSIESAAKGKLLGRSREALRRLTLLGGVYRFTRDAKYADAAKREMLNVCDFETWDPDDFLATAEMMTAVAVAYDWTYDALPPADRRTIVAGLVRLGLQPALDAYASQGGWTRATHNWNLVCNGGVIVASLALAEEEPATTKRALRLALSSIGYGLTAFDENGGTAEGPMYHSYACRYLTFAAAALATAPQRPVALTNDAAWTHAGFYRIMMTGQGGLCANFGDGAAVLGNSAWMYWHATAFDHPEYGTYETEIDRAEPSIFDLIWYVPPTRTPPPVPTFAKFGSSVVLRSAPGAAVPVFLALRTGSTADHHSHLDLGNFVLDMNGQRFAADLGADNYGMPGYFGPRRADYLRTSTPGHNTLSIGEASQPGDATAVVRGKPAKGDSPSVSIDLSQGYPGVDSVVRTAAVEGDVVSITDDLRTDRRTTFVWNLHTPAKVSIRRGECDLEAGGKHVTLRVIEPAGLTFTAEPDATRPPQLPVENSTHVRLRVPVDGKTKLKIEFSPVAP